MPDAVVLYPLYSPPLLDEISARYDCLYPGRTHPAKAYSEVERAKVIAWVGSGALPFGAELMDKFPNLKAYLCYGTGYEGVDRKAAKERGIVVCNSPGANASGVADLAVALMLAVMRDIPHFDALVKAGNWTKARLTDVPVKWSMTGRKVGIYGMGAIGRKIAARCAAFETEVQYHSPHRHDDVPYRYHATLEQLVEWCDVLQIAVRAGDHNRHIIDAAMLKRLGPDGFLVNISRGSVIEEDALIAALRDKTIGGAGVDVLQNEPHVRSDFFDLPNFVVVPHQGGHTHQAHEGMRRCVMENLAAVFAGKTPPYAVPMD